MSQGKTVGECAGISEAELIEIEGAVKVGTKRGSWLNRPKQWEYDYYYLVSDKEGAVLTLRKLIALARTPAALPDQHGPKVEVSDQPKRIVK